MRGVATAVGRGAQSVLPKTVDRRVSDVFLARTIAVGVASYHEVHRRLAKCRYLVCGCRLLSQAEILATFFVFCKYDVIAHDVVVPVVFVRVLAVSGYRNESNIA